MYVGCNMPTYNNNKDHKNPNFELNFGNLSAGLQAKLYEESPNTRKYLKKITTFFQN